MFGIRRRAGRTSHACFQLPSRASERSATPLERWKNKRGMEKKKFLHLAAAALPPDVVFNKELKKEKKTGSSVAAARRGHIHTRSCVAIIQDTWEWPQRRRRQREPADAPAPPRMSKPATACNDFPNICLQLYYYTLAHAGSLCRHHALMQLPYTPGSIT